MLTLVCQIRALHNNGVYVLYKLLQLSLMIGGRVLFDADFDPILDPTKLVSKFVLLCKIFCMMQPRVDDIFSFSHVSDNGFIVTFV